MSKTIATLLAVFLFVVAVPAAAQATHTVNGVFDYDKARQVVGSINRARQSKGLSPLKMEAALTEAAMLRAAEFAFRAEVDAAGRSSDDYGKRPNGDGNLALIGEQRNAFQPEVQYVYLNLAHKPYTNIADIIKALNSKSGSSAFLSTSMRSIGCGAFFSPQGLCYWVLFLLPTSNTSGEIYSGQWVTEVSIGVSPGEKTKIVSRTKSDTDMTPHGFEVNCRFNYNKAIEVVEIVNKERAAKGLKPCIMDSTLMELAMIRAAEMKAIKTMTHTRPNDELGTSIIRSFMECSMAGENVAFGQGSASRVMDSWMNSPPHYRNIMKPGYNRIGVGECDEYWVQLFAQYDGKSRAMSKSSGHIDEVTVWITVVDTGEESKVIKRKKVE